MEEANRQLYSQGDYPRGGNEVSRHIYAYCNKPEMKFGDMWFVLSECRKNSTGITYYQIELITYPKD